MITIFHFLFLSVYAIVNDRNRRDKMKRNAFTLIELLAVIVILAVILTIAVPAVSNYIMNTKKAIPKNNNGSHPDILSLFNAKSFLNIN